MAPNSIVYATRTGWEHQVSPRDLERFWIKVDRGGAGECWPWLARTNRDGYGDFTLADRRVINAHRLAFVAATGSLPLDLELDHLCRNRACVNPAHLEPVTHRVNMARSPHVRQRKTECLRGHAFTAENTYIKPDGERRCRACDRIRSASSVARLRAARLAASASGVI